MLAGLLFCTLSFLASLASLENGPTSEFKIVVLALSAINFCVGITELILWAAHPVQDQ